MKLRPILAAALTLTTCPGALRAEDFATFPRGAFSEAKSAEGAWSAATGHAEIRAGKSAGQQLRLLGGADEHAVTYTPAIALPQGGRLTFRAERWSGKEPFAFAVAALDATGSATPIFSGAKAVKTRGATAFTADIPAGTTAVRFTATTPTGAGVLLSDVRVEPAQPMSVAAVVVSQPVVPMLIRKIDNPAVGITLTTRGQLHPVKLTRVAVTLNGTDDLTDIAAVRLGVASTGETKGLQANGEAIANSAFRTVGAPAKPARELVFDVELPLAAGDNTLSVLIEPAPGASLDRHIDAGITAVTFADGKTLRPETPEPAGRQRIGLALRLRGDDQSKFYRIPGLATTPKGTLIAVYDIRYRHGGDLPADIDVGLSRSTDGGQTWEPMRLAMDMGPGTKDGIGDPAVLVDPKTGRIWVAALWSHGNHAWHGSGKGLSPDETAQFMLVSSDDDGRTWSKPVNITTQVKNPDWHMFFQGPGAGIALKDGTLVFPAQYQDGDLNAAGKKKGTPFSTLIYSKDGGQTWHAGTGVKADTTEAQVAELADGSIMINARDNRGGFRTVGVTKDLGATWTLHPTDRKALPDPVCMGSLLRMDTDRYGSLLLFSNPAVSGGGRHHMTVKVSQDFGGTWPARYHHLYDSRGGAGYSCLAPVGTDQVGVLYEGPCDLYYLRFPLGELLGESTR